MLKLKSTGTQKTALVVAAVSIILLVCAYLLGFAMAMRSMKSALLVAAVCQQTMLRIDSRVLTVTVVPLVPSQRVRDLAPGKHGPASKVAREMLETEQLAGLARDLGALYPLQFEVGSPLTLPDELYDSGRGQYRVDRALTWLGTQTGKASFRTVGVLAMDVYAPGYNFLFGQARLGGSVCIASSCRMGGSVKQARRSPAQRWHSIVRHEFGHTLGLTHVQDKTSVMAFGNSLSELDQQGTELTAADWHALQRLQPLRWAR